MSDLNLNERIAALSPEKRELLLRKLMEKQKIEAKDMLPQIEAELDMDNKYLPFELSEIQQVYRMGESGLFDLSGSATNIYSEYEINGVNKITRKLFSGRLEKAINRLIDRHDMLRVIVLPEGIQKILKEVPLYKIKCVDLSKKDKEFVHKELERVRMEMRTRKTQQNQWPLFELRIHYLDGKRMILHIQINSLLVDGTSRGMLISELFRLVFSPAASLPVLECNYRDYVVTWSRFKKSKTYKISREYWLKRLPNILPGPVLPLGKNVVPEITLQLETLNLELMDKQSWRNFTSYASKFGLSGSSALLSSYIDMLAFWSSTQKFSVGIVNTYRPPIHPKIEEILGNFNTMQIVTADVLVGNFIERTEKLQQQVWYNIEHPYFSGPEILREFNKVNVRSSKTTMPVFFNSVIGHSSTENPSNSNGNSEIRNNRGRMVIKILQSIMKVVGVFPELRASEINIYPSLMQLIPTIYEGSDGTIYCKWQGSKNSFPDGVLRKMADNYRMLLNKLADKEKSWREDWRETISELTRENIYETAVKDERVNIFEDINTIFFRQVEKQEHRAAIITPHRTLTYRELCTNSNKIANLLKKMGVMNDMLIAVIMEKGCEKITSVLGILQAGAAYIPIDANISNHELESLLEINKIPIIITQSWIGEKIQCSKDIKLVYLDKNDLSDLDDNFQYSQKEPGDVACVIYDSDSVDDSKFMRITYRMINNTVRNINERFNVNAEDKLLSLFPSVSGQWIYDVFGMLTVGGTIILPVEEPENDSINWSKLIQNEKITICNTSPVIMEHLLATSEDSNDLKLDSLRLILLSNERVSSKLLKKLEIVLKAATIVHLWGTSQISIWTMMHIFQKGEEAPEIMRFDQILNGHGAYILNDALQQCPVWTFGNIYIGEKSLDFIECNSNSMENKQFVRHPDTGVGLIRTKYIGRYTEEGNIEVLGHEKDFKSTILGYSILLQQIEDKLELHPDIRLSVVRLEEEVNQKCYLAAYVVKKKKSSIEMKDIYVFLKDKLPYYMIPRKLVILDSFPMDIKGRINHSSLKIISSNHKEESACRAPKNELEVNLIKIWEMVLDKDKIGIKDNFFDLGGDSLKVIKLSYLIEKEFGKKITPAHFFLDPTIKSLASLLS
jgi:non-ribosomal peptide synthetase component F/acyl carrier protein